MTQQSHNGFDVPPRRSPRQVDTSQDPQRPVQDANSSLGYITTERTVYGQQPTTERETIRVPHFPTTPAHVRVGGTVTRNLGDYNSAKVEVSVQMPCLPEQSEVERVYGMCSEWVDGMLRRELEVATGQTQAPQPQGLGPNHGQQGQAEDFPENS